MHYQPLIGEHLENRESIKTCEKVTVQYRGGYRPVTLNLPLNLAPPSFQRPKCVILRIRIMRYSGALLCLPVCDIALVTLFKIKW